MFVVGHTVSGTDEAPEITFDIVGSTGNLYKTVIGKVPTCDCPDAAKGNQCKHICYGKSGSSANPSFGTIQLYPLHYFYILFLLMAYQVLFNALKAPSHLQYQLAFLSSVSV